MVWEVSRCSASFVVPFSSPSESDHGKSSRSGRYIQGIASLYWYIASRPAMLRHTVDIESILLLDIGQLSMIFYLDLSLPTILAASTWLSLINHGLIMSMR